MAELSMAPPDFTALPVYSGVGDYHFNRFRVVFKKPAGLSAATLAQDFATNFPGYLKSQFATVTWGERGFNRKQTLKFHGVLPVLHMDIARPHNDWVVREWYDPSVGFTAQTLKREFFDIAEDIAVASAAVVFGEAGPAVAGAAVHYNRMHFLAGRRSWRVGDGKTFGVAPADVETFGVGPANIVSTGIEGGDIFVLETIAVERFSARPFQIAGGALENKIPDIWVANLNNFIQKNGLTRLKWKPHKRDRKTGWEERQSIDFFRKTDFKDLSSLKAHAEFLDAYPLFPTILPTFLPSFGHGGGGRFDGGGASGQW
jgi:hypothetical protein